MEQGAHLQLCLTCFERDISNHKQGGRSQKSFFYPSDDTEGATAQFANSFSWFQHISELQNVRNVHYNIPLLLPLTEVKRGNGQTETEQWNTHPNPVG